MAVAKAEEDEHELQTVLDFENNNAAAKMLRKLTVSYKTSEESMSNYISLLQSM